MVKAKKGKHGGKDDDLDDDIDVASVDSGNSKKRKDSEGSVGKKEKKGRKKKGDEESDDEEIIEKKSKKGKKKNVDSDNEEIVDKKSKKGKKKNDESDEDDVVDKKSKKGKKKNDESDEEEDVKANKKKGKKDKRKGDDDEDDEIASLTKKVEAVDLSKNKKKKGKNRDDDSDNDLSDDDAPKKSKGKSKDKPKGGFALLQVEDEGSGNEISPSPERPDTPEETFEKPKPGQDKGGKKGKKNRKKKDDDDDDDIDKVLAELEMEYAGIKPKDDGKKEDQNEEKAPKKPKNKAKGSKKGGDRIDDDLLDDVELEEDDDEGEKQIKSAAQKKKEKKMRQLQKKEQRDASVDSKSEPKSEEKEEAKAEPKVEDKKSKKDKKKKGEEKDKDKDKDKNKEKEDDKKAKGPGKKALLAMQETLKKIKEEEERMKKEEEERIRKEEEAETLRLEQLRLEKEKKDKKKQKEKERKERLKAEGKLLTAKQKADKARAQEMIAALRAQGVALPDPGEKKPRPGTRIRTNKSKTLVSQDSADGSEAKTEKSSPPPEVQVQIVDTKEEEVKEAKEGEDIKDTWDAESSGEEDASERVEPDAVREIVKKVAVKPKPEPEEEKVEDKEESEEESESEEEEDDDDDEEEEEESSEEESGSEDEHKTDADRKREKALARIEKRKEDAEKNKSLDNLRASVVCVLGHVDTGKTKILDKLRKTHVQDGEAGGITQQIGATNVPIDNIKEACKLVKSFNEMELKIPGLLIIDTPGHESFSNLRSRGSSLCDIAILVVDIMHGLEPQTIESINLLKTKKTPFVVALNKIDRLYNWQTGGRKDIRDILKAQAENTQLEFKQRTKEVTIQFAEQGLNAALFFENPDLRSYVSLVPTSAITGEGMGNLLALIVEFCQTMLAKRLMYSDLLLATVLEVKAISGLGTTIDCILINGKLAEGDTIILAGTDGPIVTQIRSLLMPQPMKELRVKNAYIEYKEIKAAQGVKIAAKDLEKAIAGLNLQVAQKPDEIPIYCEEVAKELKTALSSIKLKERGVYVQASTLGSLEALLEFLRTSKIPYSGIRIGPVVKKDVMKASIMLEHEPQYATILAFDVKIERDAQELADSLGVKIFQADIIYHLFDKFMAYREELKQKKRDEFKNIAVFPCKLRILPQFVFNSRDPIVVGVMVEAGIVKEGTPLCVPSKEFLNIGYVTSVEVNHKPIEAARKGQEVCLKIENPPGETPKLYGRHFDHTDLLMSRISRQSIDACKDYFRDDLTKQDWQLMVELKKLFQIL